MMTSGTGGEKPCECTLCCWTMRNAFHWPIEIGNYHRSGEKPCECTFCCRTAVYARPVDGVLETRYSILETRYLI